MEYRDIAKKFYNGERWKATRLSYLDSVGHKCERCGDAAYIVHHLTYLNAENINDATISLNHELLEALCLVCHNTEHFEKNKATVEGLFFDSQGQLKKAGGEK